MLENFNTWAPAQYDKRRVMSEKEVIRVNNNEPKR